MSIKNDRWIRRMAEEHGMIEPFEAGQVKDGNISYGLSSYGYDIRVAPEFKVFTKVHMVVVDPVPDQLELQKNWQLSYQLTHSLKLVEKKELVQLLQPLMEVLQFCPFLMLIVNY